MLARIISALRSKFGRDLVWNYVSLGVLAVSGIIINLLIVRGYGARGLGVFNQVFAVYVMASQLATGGIHYSVLKYVAEYAADKKKRDLAAWSGVYLVLGLGLALSLVVFFLSPLAGLAVNSPDVAKGLALAAPGLFFFSLNKVLLGILNGMRVMRAFALGQGLRYFLMAIYVAGAASLGAEVRFLGGTFTAAESVLCLVLLALVVPRARPTLKGFDRAWLKTHALFGFKGFLSGMILEMNARVDVLMLGLFLTDRAVGIYSFASMLGEGFYNLLVVVRNNVNPILPPLLKERKIEEIRRWIARLQRLVYAGAFGAALVAVLLYKPAVYLLLGGGEFLESWSVLAILLAGIVFCSGYVPFDFMLLQAGQPGWHTFLTSLTLASNILLNAALIPIFGVHGAAMGTALSLCLSVLYLNLMVRRRLGFSLGFFFFGPKSRS